MPPVFSASILGNVEREYVGDAWFRVRSDDRLRPGFPHFQLLSEEDQNPERLFAIQGFDGLPGLGVHQLGTFDEAWQDLARLWAQYVDFDGERYEYYAATTGTWTVTSVHSDWFTAEFTFVGVLYCVGEAGPTSDGPQGSCDPRVIDLQAPQITVEGTVMAARKRNSGRLIFY